MTNAYMLEVRPGSASGPLKLPVGHTFEEFDDFENEFQFQLQGYASAAKAVNPDAHKDV